MKKKTHKIINLILILTIIAGIVIPVLFTAERMGFFSREQVVRNLCAEPYITSEGDVKMKNWENTARFKQLFEKFLTYKGVSFQSDMEWNRGKSVSL